MSQVQNPGELIVPHETLVIDLTESANIMLAHYDYALKPNPEGIYIREKLYPIITPGMKLFEKRTGKPVAYENVCKMDSAICSESGADILTDKDMQYKHSLLCYGGFYPIAAIQLCKYILDKDLRTGWEYAVPMAGIVNALDWIKPEYADQITDEDLHSCVKQHWERIYEFANDPWRIYYTSVKANRLFIFKSVDWRIYDWTNQKWLEQQPNE